MSGRSAAARSRRASAGSGSRPTPGHGPNGSARPCSEMYASASRMISREFASHASEVSPHRDPVPAWHRPDRVGAIAADGGDIERQLSLVDATGTHATRSPKQARVSASPSGAVASAILSRGGGGRHGPRRSGRAWRCRSRGRPRPARRGSGRTPRPSRPRARRRDRPRRASGSRSSRRTARPASVRVPRSPPEPLTHSSSTARPVTGSVADPSRRCCPRRSWCSGVRSLPIRSADQLVDRMRWPPGLEEMSPGGVGLVASVRVSLIALAAYSRWRRGTGRRG